MELNLMAQNNTGGGMTDITIRLQNEYDCVMNGGVTNDHDRIARIRPVDLMRARKEILRLRTALKEIDEIATHGEDAGDIVLDVRRIAEGALFAGQP